MAEIEDFATLFADYIQSCGKLSELEALSKEIDNDMYGCRSFIALIKDKINSSEKPAVSDEDEDETYNDLTRHEDISQFLECSSSKLLLDDMNVAPDLDVDESLRKFKTIIAELKDDAANKPSDHHEDNRSKITKLDIDDFSASLDQLCIGLAAITTLENGAKSFEKNVELEAKLPQLFQDVEMFTKMVQSKTKLSQSVEEWKTNEISATLPYSDIVKSVLTFINDVTFKFLEYKKMMEADENAI